MFYRAEISDKYLNRDFFHQMKHLQYQQHSVTCIRKSEKKYISHFWEQIPQKHLRTYFKVISVREQGLFIRFLLTSRF